MKLAFAGLALLGVGASSILLASCAARRPLAVLTLVGPPPYEEARASPSGELVVFSATDSDGDDDPDAAMHHSGYWIHSAEGTRLKYVSNWVGTFLEDPAVVALAPGRYRVVARAANSGMVTVPFIVEAGRTTTVYLDGRKPPVGPTQPPAAAWVLLPEGYIVGWRAPADGGPK